eukprot:5543789-Prymnesium_polylepis.8
MSLLLTASHARRVPSVRGRSHRVRAKDVAARPGDFGRQYDFVRRCEGWQDCRRRHFERHPSNDAASKPLKTNAAP